MIRFRLAALAAVILACAAPARADPAPCRSAGVRADSYCQVGEARLHFVDWGGKGPPLILLAGFGATARVFDDLAPRLTALRRVYTVTRRGFGGSRPSPAPADAKPFAADIIGLMDALGLARADLVGHSAAGVEMALLARQHPARVRRLVYLDAAYDFRTALALQGGDPLDRRPPPAALGGWATYAAFRAASLGVRPAVVEPDVRQQFRLDGGRLVPVTAEDEAMRLGAALLPEPPDYARIPAPSLAIYAPKDQPEQVPPGAIDTDREAARAYGVRRIRPWMLREQARFLETAPCGVAFERPGASHHFFLTDPDWTARTVLAFLEAEEPCAWRPPHETSSKGPAPAP